MKCVLNAIKREKIISVIRTNFSTELREVFTSLYDGGIRVIEISMDTPQALKKIESLSAQFPDIHIGVGTVLDAETARLAILSGASFLLSPIIHAGTIEMANRYNIPIIPGVFTPTEIITAKELGADVVKVFPVGSLGPSYIKELKGPLGHIEMIPVGGLTNENAIEFLKSGSFALGMGSYLVNDQLVKERNFSEIKKRAQSLVNIVSDFKERL